MNTSPGLNEQKWPMIFMASLPSATRSVRKCPMQYFSFLKIQSVEFSQFPVWTTRAKSGKFSPLLLCESEQWKICMNQFDSASAVGKKRKNKAAAVLEWVPHKGEGTRKIVGNLLPHDCKTEKGPGYGARNRQQHYGLFQMPRHRELRIYQTEL